MENTTRQEVKELTVKLEEGLNEMYHSGRYAEMLKFYSRFHHYSVNNCMLILLQKPEASLVAGFQTWKKQGRFVKRGEKGIRIFAPCPHKFTVEVTNDKGEKVEEEHTWTGFKAVSVFDISQTDGKEIPEVTDTLTASLENYESLLKLIIQESDVPITFEDFPEDAFGYYDLKENKIVVKPGLSNAQTVKTLIHERAHSIMHTEDGEERSQKEIEAESVAYIVSSWLGIDTSAYSFGYVAQWSRTEDTKQLKESLGRIQQTAAYLIDRYKAGTVGTAGNEVPPAEPEHEEPKQAEPATTTALVPYGVSADGSTLHLEQGRAYCNVMIDGLMNLNAADFKHFLKCWNLTDDQKAYLAKRTKDRTKKSLLTGNKIPAEFKQLAAFLKNTDNVIINREDEVVYITDSYVMFRIGLPMYLKYFPEYPDTIRKPTMWRCYKNEDFSEIRPLKNCENFFRYQSEDDFYYVGEDEESLHGKKNDRWYNFRTESGTNFCFKAKTYEMLKKMGGRMKAIVTADSVNFIMKTDHMEVFGIGMRTAK